ncbi:hypothetical protein [Paraliomyxa miuraensis]|uniref:hypothetical protein n=1 Tax=Paraliomyxa miuraensis TaxID=376150 RepID=UPI002252FA3E|nr:hypothetical protein [Paraliomyxa miuraensis]MCX4246732.1 hypothetical protein [Paraliomyxa miuraensis]
MKGVALLVGGMLSLLGSGCGSDELEDTTDFGHQRLVEIADEVTCVPLVAGKEIDAGTVCASIDNTVDTSNTCGTGATGVMNVTYATTGGWELERARMAVGVGLEDIPTNRRGKAKLHLFPYDSGDVTGATEHTFAVPLCQLGLDGAYDACDPVLAHISNEAELRKPKKKPGKYQQKLAWGDGELLGRRWRQGKYYTMELQCVADEPPPPPLAGCETAYAHGPGAICFLGADLDGDGEDDGFANWGWTNGPIAPGTSTSWPVYAAVGGCDPSAGELVGNLAVSYSGSVATVTFERVGDVLLDEEQIHVGTEPLPRDEDGALSINPADAAVVVDLDGVTTSSHTITGLSGDIYLSYHAIACGDGIEPPSDPLASLTDEFQTDSLASWNIHNPQTATVAIDDGALVMVPNPNTWWYMSDEALHVSKLVTGNFAVTTRMEVTNLAGGPTAPGAPYRIGGIMVRDPGSADPNTYHMGIGNMNQPEVVTVSKSTDDGYSQIGTTPWTGIEAEMRICRFGSTVQSFVRLPEQPWAWVDDIQRGDLPSTVAVGPIAYAGTAEPDLVAEADYVHFQTVDKIEDCWRD